MGAADACSTPPVMLMEAMLVRVVLRVETVSPSQVLAEVEPLNLLAAPVDKEAILLAQPGPSVLVETPVSTAESDMVAVVVEATTVEAAAATQQVEVGPVLFPLVEPSPPL